MGLESGSARAAAELHRDQRDRLAAMSGQSAFAKLPPSPRLRRTGRRTGRRAGRRDLAEAMGSYKTSPWRRWALSSQPVELGTKSSP
jgi:hypothetical protein